MTSIETEPLHYTRSYIPVIQPQNTLDEKKMKPTLQEYI